jgi:hypothetical protein
MSYEGYHTQHRLAIGPIHEIITNSSQVFVFPSLLSGSLQSEFR